MKLADYIKQEHGDKRGALQQFANDIGRPYQSVQKWIKAGYIVQHGQIMKRHTIIVHTFRGTE